MKNPTADILDRLYNVAAILIPLLYWLAVVTVVVVQLSISAIKYISPLVAEHVTRQMGRKVYSNNVNLNNYFLELI